MDSIDTLILPVGEYVLSKEVGDSFDDEGVDTGSLDSFWNIKCPHSEFTLELDHLAKDTIKKVCADVARDSETHHSDSESLPFQSDNCRCVLEFHTSFSQHNDDSGIVLSPKNY